MPITDKLVKIKEKANEERRLIDDAWRLWKEFVSRFQACDYYDAVTAGILWEIRKLTTKTSYAFSMKIIDKHRDELKLHGFSHSSF